MGLYLHVPVVKWLNYLLFHNIVLLCLITQTETQKQLILCVFSVGRVWLKGRAQNYQHAGMEDDYLPLYEVVNNDNKDNPANNSGYERLVNDANSVQEEYDLPQSDTSYVRYPAYSEIATEIQKLKQNSRHLKMVLLIGGVVMFMILIIIVCVFAGMWIRFGRNLAHVQKSYEQIDYVQRTLTKQIDVLNEAYHTLGSQGSFQNCSQETTACNFTYRSTLRSWMYCDTPNLQTHKTVS